MVERQLREYFEQDIRDDPGVAPGEMARTAITEGRRLRRRRYRMAVAAGVAVIGAATGLGLSVRGPMASPPVTIEAAMMPAAAPSCTPRPVESDATDVVILLESAITDEQITAARTALEEDQRVETVTFENRQQAYARFRARWKHHPDLLKAVENRQLSESFRLRLVEPSQYTAVRAQYAGMKGIMQIIGRRCSPDAPVGGVQ